MAGSLFRLFGCRTPFHRGTLNGQRADPFPNPPEKNTADLAVNWKVRFFI